MTNSMDNICVNCAAKLDVENSENLSQSELLLTKKYYALDVKSRITRANPLSSRNTPSSRPVTPAVEEISIYRALSAVFNLNSVSGSKTELETEEQLPICFVCHLILNDLYRAYLEFSQLRTNNSYLGKKLSNSNKSRSRDRREREPEHDVQEPNPKRFRNEPSVSTLKPMVVTTCESSICRKEDRVENILINSESEEQLLESSSDVRDETCAGVTEARLPVRLKFEVYENENDETEMELRDNQDITEQDQEYQSETVDLDFTPTSFKSEPDDDRIGIGFEVNAGEHSLKIDPDHGHAASFIETISNSSSTSPLFAHPHHSRVQIGHGSSSSSFSVTSPFVEDNDNDTFSAEYDADPLSIPDEGSFDSSRRTRTRSQMGLPIQSESNFSEMILPNASAVPRQAQTHTSSLSELQRIATRDGRSKRVPEMPLNFGTSKLAILNMIRDKKDFLFGKVTDTLTSKDKEDNWKVIAESARALGVLKLNKSWTYLRDVTYMNWRRATLVKLDNKNKTRSKGGSSVQYNDCDLIILDIIGKDSLSIQNMHRNRNAGVLESSGTDSSAVSVPAVIADTPLKVTVPNPNSDESNSKEVDETCATPEPVVSTKLSVIKNKYELKPKDSESSSDSKQLEELNSAKLKLEIEGLKLENKKRNLDILNFEKSLGLPYSSNSVLFLKENFNVIDTTAKESKDKST